MLTKREYEEAMKKSGQEVNKKLKDLSGHCAPLSLLYGASIVMDVLKEHYTIDMNRHEQKETEESDVDMQKLNEALQKGKIVALQTRCGIAFVPCNEIETALESNLNFDEMILLQLNSKESESVPRKAIHGEFHGTVVTEQSEKYEPTITEIPLTERMRSAEDRLNALERSVYGKANTDIKCRRTK